MKTPHQWEQPLAQLAYRFAQPQVTGVIKAQPSDFIVEEVLGFTPSGDGEHVFVKIEKSGLNTLDACKRIAKTLKFPIRQITYSGLKDKNALTQQWISFPWPIKKALDCTILNDENIKVLEETRHQKKLRIGTHKANRFSIRVTQVSSLDGIVSRGEMIQKEGVPNYFGEQRFGRFGNNLQFANRMFIDGEVIRDRKLNGLVLSAARSHLFNLITSHRIESNNFDVILPNDVVQLAGSRSHFIADAADSTLEVRRQERDIYIAAPMIGEDIVLSDATKQVLNEYSGWITGLQSIRLNTEFRPLQVFPKDFELTESASEFTVTFELPTGSFATSVLRELVNLV